MKKIAILSRDLNVGGIQRSLLNLLQNINLKKYQIDCYLYNINNFYNDDIPENIKVFYLSPRSKIIKFIPFKIAKFFSKCKLEEEKYDYVIDFDGYQTDTALDIILSNCKNKVCWIHQNAYMKAKEEIKYRILHYFMKGKYKYYNKFVAVSKGIIEPFEKLNKMKINKNCIVIPNYINTKVIFEKANEQCDLKINKSKYNFVSVGRICNAKGYDILINYLHELTNYRQDFHFYLIGDGIEREKIKSLINKLNLNSYVTLLGNQTNPFKYLNLMDGFILTSRYEGQGMVLLEAKSLGLELFMSKNLEQYNEGLIGYEDLILALKSAKRKVKKKDDLKSYNANITKRVEELLK